jgi:predicted  nucleic acid-binding Zn-ribbon protein
LSHSSFHLYQLQKVDLRIDQVNQRLEKIEAQLNDNPRLREAEKQVSLDQAAVTKVENDLAALENVSTAKKVKIEQSEAALYSGKNTNPKELKDLQAEIESLKRTLSANEEEQLNSMAALEDEQAKLKASQAIHATVSAEIEQENSQLIIEKNNLNKEKEKLLTEHNAAQGQIPAEILAIYEKLRTSKNHIAVTAIDDQCCSTCGSEITASDIQKARASTALSFCPSCGRILYAG